MHIHAYEKIWLAVSVLLILFLIGSVTYGAVGPGVAMVSDTEPAIDSGGLDEDERFSGPVSNRSVKTSTRRTSSPVSSPSSPTRSSCQRTAP